MDQLQTKIQWYKDYLVLANFSPRTITMYIRTIRNYYDYLENRPTRIEDQESAQQYLLKRLSQGSSWSTINCDYSALRKYFKEILDKEWSLKKLPRPRKDRILPKILSQEDVIRLIEGARLYKHQIFLTFVYATGLRLSEALAITFEDIDGDRLQIRVNKGKGHKDRCVQIPQCLLDLLRTYYKRCKPKHYLFNGYKETSFSRRAAQWSIVQARKKAGINKTATIHTLRHCYATHHIENGT